MIITPEMIEALDILRQIARDGKIGVYSGIARAVDTLDNADFFVPIDEAREEQEESA